MDAKRGLKNDIKQNIDKVSESPYKLLITKGEIVTAVAKTGGHHFDQVIKVNIASNGTHWYHVAPDVMHWEGHKIIFVVFWPQMHNLNLIMKIIKLTPVKGILQRN